MRIYLAHDTIPIFWVILKIPNGLEVVLSLKHPLGIKSEVAYFTSRLISPEHHISINRLAINILYSSSNNKYHNFFAHPYCTHTHTLTNTNVCVGSTASL